MLYRVVLKQKSEYLGDIKASTLFGAFLTVYSSYVDLSPEFINDIVFSDLFVKDNLPIGVKNNVTIYQKDKFAKKDIVNRFLINRTLISRDLEQNNVPIVASAYRGTDFEFFISSEILSIDELKVLIPRMLVLGIGKWRNVGKGQFDFVSIKEYVPNLNSNKFVALSDFKPTYILKEDEICDDNIGYFIRDAFATNGKKQQIVTLFSTGTCFNHFKDFVGEHIYDKNSETYIHAKSIVIGV